MAATCRVEPEADAMAVVDASLRLRKIDCQQIVSAFAMLSGIRSKPRFVIALA
jgi:hypothetical protein